MMYTLRIFLFKFNVYYYVLTSCELNLVPETSNQISLIPTERLTEPNEADKLNPPSNYLLKQHMLRLSIDIT